MKKKYILQMLVLWLLFLTSACVSSVKNEFDKDTEEIKYEESIPETDVSRQLTNLESSNKKGIRIYYKSAFQNTYAFYKVNNNWNSLPGQKLDDSTDRAGYEEIEFSQNSVAIMFNDGNDNWDSKNKRKVLYIIIGKGDFIIENHQIKKIKPLKSKYDSMFIKGDFSNNEPVKMKLVEDNTWQITLYGRTSFIFDIYGDGSTILGDNEKDGNVEKDGNSINIDRNKYQVTFFEKTKTYKIEKQETVPQIVKDFSFKVLENNTLSIFVDNIVDKPDGVRIYKALCRDGEYKLYNEMAYTGEKWETEVFSMMSLNEMGNEDGKAYYYLKSYVGDIESDPTEIVELNVKASHNPLSKLDKFEIKYSSSGYTTFSWQYNYQKKPEGIRVYKSLSKGGEYVKLYEVKLSNNMLPEGGTSFRKESGNENGYAYYYAVPFIGENEGIPTDIIEIKVQ